MPTEACTEGTTGGGGGGRARHVVEPRVDGCDGADAAVGGESEAEGALRRGPGPLAPVGVDARVERGLVVRDGTELVALVDLQAGEERGPGIGGLVSPAARSAAAARPVVLLFTAPVPKKPPDDCC